MEILGIDIGGSGIKGAIVDTENGEKISKRHRIPTPQPATPKAVADVIAEIVKHFDWKGNIGCGFPAVIQKGVVRTASNIANEWIGVNAAEMFTQKTGCPTTIVNDADAAGLAEMKFGAGRDFDGFVILITVGTGIGTVLFTQGKLVPNTELGHIMLDGMVAENFAADRVRKEKDLSWKAWAKRFDKYLNRIEFLLWPDLIILGGGVSKKMDKFKEYLTLKTEIIPAGLRNHAGIIGAAVSAMK